MSIEQREEPYVISQDVGSLVTNWNSLCDISVPNESFFKGMTLDLENKLKTIFPKVEVVDFDFISRGMNSLVENSELPVISLDRCYVNNATNNLFGFLDVSRCVNQNLEKIGISGRNEQGISSQLDILVPRLGLTKDIAIVDDVLFEGKTHKYVFDLFKSRGITVRKVLVGISIGTGKSLLESNGIEVNSLVSYKSVTDEICERDFSAGVPFSGRTVITNDGVYGAPYIYPFGKPSEWASIPADAVNSFSDFCLESSINLWSNIQRMSRRLISTDEVPKKIFGLEKNISVVEALKLARSR